MMAIREIRFGIIGGGLMGREFASAAARWLHLVDLPFRPIITGVCDVDPRAVAWFERNVPTVEFTTGDHRVLLEDERIEAIYCAIPHNLHAKVYTDVIESGKHLLGEKPFGIDLPANEEINRAMAANPDVFVRCSSEFPFYPGAYQLFQWARDGRFGRIIEVEAGFWHSSDLNPQKPINWKRRIATNGEYGCMGDLGMHVAHLPLRLGWRPANVRAVLSNLIAERPDGKGGMAACETWDNATLATEVKTAEYSFPMTLSTKRIAPGHANTWFVRMIGTELSAEYSTKNPKALRFMPYEVGGEQAWRTVDVPHASAYPSITGAIFEFGFSDALLQMWASFCDELVNRDGMRQPLHCATPEEARQTHVLFTAALASQRDAAAVPLDWDAVVGGFRTREVRNA